MSNTKHGLVVPFVPTPKVAHTMNKREVARRDAAKREAERELTEYLLLDELKTIRQFVKDGIVTKDQAKVLRAAAYNQVAKHGFTVLRGEDGLKVV